MSPVCKPRPLHWSRVFLGYSSGTSSAFSRWIPGTATSLMAVLIFLDRVHLGNGQCPCGNSEGHCIGPDFYISWLDVASEASGSSLPGSPGKHGVISLSLHKDLLCEHWSLNRNLNSQLWHVLGQTTLCLFSKLWGIVASHLLLFSKCQGNCLILNKFYASMWASFSSLAA